ncbi:MAG TPA: dynamin family protein [Pseudonocardia sp.]|nr:dynamin family protein [Pseudonocardia sp.]
MPAPTLVTAVRALLLHAREVYRDRPEAAGWLGHQLRRLDEPLRLAVAGKVKAGKSTLLNALVGEEIAPTDAGECTRVVTWYEDGHAPRVTLFAHRAPPRPLRLDRSAGTLRIDLEGTPPEEIERLVVAWPSAQLRETTLIDTPGIASVSAATSAGTSAFLTPEDSPTAADAVLYLMRHLHAADLRFLEAFHDRGVARAAPVNTIAVLSRADEIGVGRLDALLSAKRIAARYRQDESLRGLCQTVVAVAGLLAHTGRTMRQDEHRALVALAALPEAELAGLLLSADRFARPDGPATVPPDVRRALLERFGLFGLRLGTSLIGRGLADPSRLAAELVKRSGLDDLRRVLAAQFTERRDLLKARSALLAVEMVLAREPRPAAAPLAAEVERILAGAHEFAELQLLADLRNRTVRLPKDALAEAERLLGADGGAATARLGAEPDTDPAQLREIALDALVRWRRRAESPLAGRDVTGAAQVVVRSCEGVLAGLPR